MELFNWYLNAIDNIFLPRSVGIGELACPDGTFYAGYTFEQVESDVPGGPVCEVDLFGTLIAAIIEFKQLLEELKKHAGRDRMELHQKVGLTEELLTQSLDEDKKLSYILGQNSELCRCSLDMRKKNEEFEALLRRLVQNE